MSITSKRAADILGMAVSFNGCGRCTSDELKEAVNAAQDALQEKAERDNPVPLTYDELLQMNDEVVWLEVLDESDRENPCESAWSQVWVANWMPPPVVYFWRFGNECEIDPNPNNYGKTWVCYRHKPKEG